MYYYKWHKELQPILYLLQQSNHKVVEKMWVSYKPLRVQFHLHITSWGRVKKVGLILFHFTQHPQKYIIIMSERHFITATKAVSKQLQFKKQSCPNSGVASTADINTTAASLCLQ